MVRGSSETLGTLESQKRKHKSILCRWGQVGIVFDLLWVPDQKGAASAGGTGSAIDVNSPDPTSFATHADFALPHGTVVTRYREVSELHVGLSDTVDVDLRALSWFAEYVSLCIELADLLKLWRTAGHARRLVPGLLVQLRSGEALVAMYSVPARSTPAEGPERPRTPGLRRAASEALQAASAAAVLERETATNQALATLRKACTTMRSLGTGGKISASNVGIGVQVVGGVPLKHLRLALVEGGSKLAAVLSVQSALPAAAAASGAPPAASSAPPSVSSARPAADLVAIGKVSSDVRAALELAFAEVDGAEYTDSRLKLPKFAAVAFADLLGRGEAKLLEIERRGYSVENDECERKGEYALPVGKKEIPVTNLQLKIAVEQGRLAFVAE